MTQSEQKCFPAINLYLLGALLISLSIATFVQREAILNPLAINDDVRNQIYWMARLTDPGLFPHDYIADYFTRHSLVSPLLWWLYRLASSLIPPERFSQLLPLLLAPLASFFAYRFGDRFAGRRFGFLLAFSFNLIIWLSRNLAGGLARAFAYPLLFAMLWLLSPKNEPMPNESPGAPPAPCLSPLLMNQAALILIMALASLIYPPVLFLGLTVWLSTLLPRLGPLAGPLWVKPPVSSPKSQSSKLTSLLFFGISLGVSGGILIQRYILEPASARFGPLANSVIATQTPEFYERGRVPIFHYFQQPIHLPWPTRLFAELLARTPGLSRLIPLLAILLAVWAYQKWLAPRFGKLQVPPITWRLLACSVITYALAWPALFYLYVPERYLQLSMPILYTVLLAAFLERLLFWLAQSGGTLLAHRLKLAAPLLLGLVIFSPLWDENLMVPDPALQPILNYLSHTPKATLVAATPALASNIPFYARRSVLLSEEACIPFHRRYFQEMKARLHAFLIAYYSVTPAALNQWLQRSSVQYLLINTDDFTDQRIRKLDKKYYHSFPKSFYTQLTAAHRPEDFLLSHPKAACRLVESGPYILISAQRVLNGACW